MILAFLNALNVPNIAIHARRGLHFAWNAQRIHLEFWTRIVLASAKLVIMKIKMAMWCVNVFINFTIFLACDTSCETCIERSDKCTTCDLSSLRSLDNMYFHCVCNFGYFSLPNIQLCESYWQLFNAIKRMQ
jgi:hypothetical protein